MSEILAPAGDKNSVFAAVNAGANAIYLGMKEYSARSSAENFDYENFEEIAKYCRAFGVKVYVAMNTLVKDGELEDFLSCVVKVWNKGADAIIISDVFLGKYIKDSCPEIVLHLSTQAGVCNTYGAKLAKEYGFDRVILARETAFEDVEEIAKIIETEVFVQGALCTCFSGQCYLSSFAGGNSGNRGKCKQPCRKKYSIDRAGFEERAYRLSLSDLCAGENVNKLIEAGVASFKIEGRMRRPEYVAAAVKYYRNLIDNCEKSADLSDLSDLKRTFNRGNYTKGLAFGQDKSFISSSVQGHIGEFVGVIRVENGKFLCQTRQKFVKGDCFKILRDGKEVGGATFCGEVKGGFSLSSKSRLKNGDKAFVTTDTGLNSRLLSLNR
ncbi:MAG: U32 family peptidase, partial [Clostridia bacterium]|nr:U32 family peptidase [Clostridia bacterium]